MAPVRRTLALLVLLLTASCAASSGSRADSTTTGEDAPAWHFLRARYDADGDGRIAAAEYTRPLDAFRRLDADGDGSVSGADFDPKWDGVPRIEAEPGKAESGRWISFDDFAHGEGGPEVGEPAPNFRLSTTAGDEIELASFRGKRPVALVFGSYT